VAEIVAGVGCSHAPSIAHAYDHQLTQEPAWKPLFDAFAESHRWLMRFRPDVLVVIYNDHVDQYFYDAWPTFSIGLADEYQIPDEGLERAIFRQFPGTRRWRGMLLQKWWTEDSIWRLRIACLSITDFFRQCLCSTKDGSCRLCRSRLTWS